MTTIMAGAGVLVLRQDVDCADRGTWEKNLSSCWRDVARLLTHIQGCYGLKALWNIDDSGDTLFLFYWDTAERCLVFSKSTGGREIATELRRSLRAPKKNQPCIVVNAEGVSTEVMKPGTLLAVLTAKAKSKKREAFAAELAPVYSATGESLHTQDGFIGHHALWDLDDSRGVHAIAVWESLEKRLAYERTIAPGVRGRTETVLEGPFPRPKYVVVKTL